MRQSEKDTSHWKCKLASIEKWGFHFKRHYTVGYSMQESTQRHHTKCVNAWNKCTWSLNRTLCMHCLKPCTDTCPNNRLAFALFMGNWYLLIGRLSLDFYLHSTLFFFLIAQIFATVFFRFNLQGYSFCFSVSRSLLATLNFSWLFLLIFHSMFFLKFFKKFKHLLNNFKVFNIFWISDSIFNAINLTILKTKITSVNKIVDLM